MPRTARREKHCDGVLSVGSGFGGFQSAIVLTRPSEWEDADEPSTKPPHRHHRHRRRRPNGASTDTFWKATQEGVSVLGRVTREGCEQLPLRVAGEVRDFDPLALIEERYLVQTDRFTHFAMAAADLALEDARLGRADYEGSPFGVGW